MAKILDVGSGYSKTKVAYPAVYVGVVGYTGYRGTASLPPVSFEEDPDTGVYSNAANSLDVAAGGSRIASFDSTGLNVRTGNYLGQIGSAADFALWYPAAAFPTIYFTTGTWTATRIAAVDYSMRHTAAAQTSTIEVPLIFSSALRRIAASTGFKPTSVKDIEQIVTAALTTNTPDTAKVVYANNVANATTTTAVFGTITGTSPTATQANPYVTALTFGTPIYLADLNGYYFTKSVVLAATTAYDYYGFMLYGTVTA